VGRRKLKDRKCGDCEECCITLHISDLNKPKHTRCPHLKVAGSGCAIYGKRPQECAAFQCVWTKREVAKSLKPNHVGMMAYYVDSQFGPTLMVTETRPGAYEKNPQAREAYIGLAEKKNIAAIIATYDGKATAMVP
jgi:Fe-S-cluster containining protein